MPSKILFYRDGVSESQYQKVIDKEIPQVFAAWEACRKDAKPPAYSCPANTLKLTFIVVTKRHHTRFYPSSDAASYESRTGVQASAAIARRINGNIQPGTAITTHVTAPDRCSFFVQSHAAIKGTARGAYYVCLRNDINLSENLLVKLVSQSSQASGHCFDIVISTNKQRRTHSATILHVLQRECPTQGPPTTLTVFAIAVLCTYGSILAPTLHSRP